MLIFRRNRVRILDLVALSEASLELKSSYLSEKLASFILNLFHCAIFSSFGLEKSLDFNQAYLWRITIV
jgi:hypothetical protein